MENGKKMITVVGAYMILKGILNLILGFSASNLVSLLFAAVLIFATDSIQPVCDSHFSGTDFLGQLAGEPVEFGLELDLSGGRLAGCRCSCHFGIP